jgi:hypothetical protein
VVGGGGGGTGGGGGGGGGVKTGTTSFAKNSKVPVIIGNGGSGTSLPANWAKSNGENSSIGDVVAYGGGGGGFSNDIAPTALIDPSLPGETTGNYDIIVNDYTYFPPLTAPTPVAGTKVAAFGLTKGVAWDFGGSDQVSTVGRDTSGFKFINDGTSSFTAEAFFYATDTTKLGSLFNTATNSNQIGFWFGMNSAVPPTTPAQVDLTITLKGGGGGGGGNDSNPGADGQPGSIVTIARTAFSTGEAISIFPGEGGGPGVSGQGSAAGGAGGRSGGGYGGGTGSAAGPYGSSGGGGGGGAASVVVFASGDTAVALGGGGGGGGGNVGSAAGRGPSGGVSGSHQGSGGTGKGGDGGGAGGGGGGWAGGAGGAVQSGDQGGYSGTSGTNYVSGVGAVAGTSAANGGGHAGGVGGDGSVVISYQSGLGALFTGGTITIDGTTVTHTFTPSQSFNTTFTPSLAAVQTPATGKPGSFSFWQLTGGNTYRVFSTANSVYSANTWNHVAFVYNQVANTAYLYLNGVSTPLTTNTVYYAPTYVPRNASPSTTLKIGAGFAGSLSNLRITKAIVYGTNFTPSTDPLTVLTGTVLLTAGQPSLVDESGNYNITKPATATYSFKSVPVGNLNYDTYDSGTWTYNRILNITKPFVLTTYDKLQFQINRSSDSSTRWGEIPDQGSDYFLLEYSVDGSTNWITLDTTNVDDVSGDTWVEKFVTLPVGAKISAGVYLRYRNHGTMSGNRIPPRDNWAVTTLYSGIGGAGRSGGSGGGGAAGITSKPPNPAQPGGIATAGGAQGYNGGSGSYEGYNYAGGGGGGAGSAGNNYSAGATASNGGTGIASLLLIGQATTAKPTPYYGGGGGGIRRGGYWSATTGLGVGGGGNGYGESSNIVRRTAGDGLSSSGGGGGGFGGNGGSGVVIIRYPASEPLAKGGEISSYTLGGILYQVHQFRTSDTLEVLPIKAGVVGEGVWTAVKTMWKKYNGAWIRVYPTPSAAATISPTSATVQCYIANTSSAVTYTMINDGDEDINVLSAAISSNPNFTVNMDYTGFGGSVVTTITAKARKTFALTVTGTSNGTSTANIVFTLNIGVYGTSTASFSITGTIIPLYATASINTTALTLLGDRNAAVPNPLGTVTIRNTGNGPLNISAITASKSIAAIGSAPASVAAGSSQAFTVKLPDILRNTQWFHYLDNSVYFNGSSALVYKGAAETGNSLFTIAGDFTAECWIYQIDRPKIFNAIFEIGYYPETSILVRSGSAAGDGGSYRDFWIGQNYDLGNLSQAISLGAWNHVAVSRSGSAVTAFVNGIPIINATMGGVINPSGHPIAIGGDVHATASQQFHGYISNFRFINGTCLYPPGAKFTLPLAAPEIVGGAATRLLTCQTSFNDPRAGTARQYTATVVGTPLMCTLGPSTTTGANRVLDDTIFIDSNSTGGRLTVTATFPSVDGGSNVSGLVADWQMDNIRDQWKVISQPAGVLNVSYNSNAWGAFINAYGIWWGSLVQTGTYTLVVSVWFPTAGVYSFYSSVDNTASITLDDNTLFSNVTIYESFGSVSGQVGAGYHTISITANNGGGPGGIALRINNPDGSELWNTRYITAYGVQRTALRDYKTNSRLGIIAGATAGTIPDTTIPGYKFGANASSYIQIVPNQPDLYVTDVKAESSTFECWCYPTGKGQSTDYGGEFFNHDSDFEACRMSDGRIAVAWDWGVGTDTKLPGGGWIITPMQLVPLNTATHVAIVVDAYTLIIYINGKYAWSTEMDRQATNNTGTSTWIGNRQGGSQGFDGWIGAMRVWNYARTAQQISQNYNKIYTYPNV